MSSFGQPQSFTESFGKIHRTAATDLQNRMKPIGKKKVGNKAKDDLYLSFCTDLAFAVRDLLMNEFRIKNIDARTLAVKLYGIYVKDPLAKEKLRDAEKCRQEVSAILNLTKLG